MTYNNQDMPIEEVVQLLAIQLRHLELRMARQERLAFSDGMKANLALADRIAENWIAQELQDQDHMETYMRDNYPEQR